MTIASHNTFTYRTPIQWFLRPFAFMARCQGKSLEEQFRKGVRVFDLRVRVDKDRVVVIAHNAFVYVRGEKIILRFLEWLNAEAKCEGAKTYIRILHEVRNERQAKYSTGKWFNLFCTDISFLYPHLTFFGGQRTMDWRQDHVFPPENYIDYIERHASVRWPKWLHWCPWIYAKLYNKTNDRLLQDKEIVVYQDFI